MARHLHGTARGCPAIPDTGSSIMRVAEASPRAQIGMLLPRRKRRGVWPLKEILTGELIKAQNARLQKVLGRLHKFRSSLPSRGGVSFAASSSAMHEASAWDTGHTPQMAPHQIRGGRPAASRPSRMVSKPRKHAAGEPGVLHDAVGDVETRLETRRLRQCG